jgi:heptosyltransferase-1
VSRASGAGPRGPRERAREGAAAGTESPRILIVRLGSLGDLVHTLPAVAALRRARPQSEIDWLVDAPHKPFLELVPVISSLVVLNGRSIGAWMAARRMLRAKRYDVALDFQGLVKSAALARLSGAKQVIGFDRAALRESMAALFYTERVNVGEGTHVIRKNLRLAAALGATADGLEFPIGPVSSATVATLAAAGDRSFVLINPGAAWPNKRWPPARFGEVARLLHAQHAVSSVVAWGPGEQAAAEEVVRSSGGAARLAPATGLQDYVALARLARLVISGDTGPLHLAAAVGVPAVALFGPTNPARNGPWAPEDTSLSEYTACRCHYQRRCHEAPAQWCLARISVDQVVSAAGDRLRRASAAAGPQR